jgi:hypothetical protein
MLDIVVVLEALCATLLADVFVSTSALGGISSGLEMLRNIGDGLLNGLCELRVIFRFCIIDHVKIIHGGIRDGEAVVAAGHARLQMRATFRGNSSAVPFFAVLIHVAFLAGRLAAGPVWILHVARVCDHLTALGFAAVSGTVCFAMIEMLAVIFLQACADT